MQTEIILTLPNFLNTLYTCNNIINVVLNLHLAGSLYPLVILAQPVLQPFNVAHSA